MRVCPIRRHADGSHKRHAPFAVAAEVEVELVAPSVASASKDKLSTLRGDDVMVVQELPVRAIACPEIRSATVQPDCRCDGEAFIAEMPILAARHNRSAVPVVGIEAAIDDLDAWNQRQVAWPTVLHLP